MLTFKVIHIEMAKSEATSLSFRDDVVNLNETTIKYNPNVPCKFADFLNRKIQKMIDSIDEYPLDGNNDCQRNVREKLVNICVEFMHQLSNLGK